jgi:hypothetical protein
VVKMPVPSTVVPVHVQRVSRVSSKVLHAVAIVGILFEPYRNPNCPTVAVIDDAIRAHMLQRDRERRRILHLELDGKRLRCPLLRVLRVEHERFHQVLDLEPAWPCVILAAGGDRGSCRRLVSENVRLCQHLGNPTICMHL